MMQGHQERVFGLHDRTGHISRAVFNDIINPKRKMHLKFQGQEFLLQNQKYFHHQVSVNAFDSTLFIHITNKASRLSQVVFILKPLCEDIFQMKLKALLGNQETLVDLITMGNFGSLGMF